MLLPKGTGCSQGIWFLSLLEEDILYIDGMLVAPLHFHPKTF